MVGFQLVVGSHRRQISHSPSLDCVGDWGMVKSFVSLTDLHISSCSHTARDAVTVTPHGFESAVGVSY